MRTLTAVVVLAALLACAGLPVAPVPVEPIPLDPGPPPPVRSSTMPAGPFDGGQTWIGSGPVEGGWWAPNEGVVVLSADAWREVESGARFSAVAADGALSLTFSGTSDAPCGCGPPGVVAGFDADRPVSGAVWISATAPTLAPSAAIPSRPPTRSRRLYRLPFGAEMDLQPGRSLVEVGGARPWLQTWELPDGGLDLTREDAIGPHYPALVLEDGEALVLVVRQHAADAVSFEAVRIADRSSTSLGRTRVPAMPCP